MKRFRIDATDIPEEIEAKDIYEAFKIVRNEIAIIEVDKEGCDL